MRQTDRIPAQGTLVESMESIAPMVDGSEPVPPVENAPLLVLHDREELAYNFAACPQIRELLLFEAHEPEDFGISL